MERKKEEGGKRRGKGIQGVKSLFFEHEISDKCGAINFHALMPLGSPTTVNVSDEF